MTIMIAGRFWESEEEYRRSCMRLDEINEEDINELNKDCNGLLDLIRKVELGVGLLTMPIKGSECFDMREILRDLT